MLLKVDTVAPPVCAIAHAAGVYSSPLADVVSDGAIGMKPGGERLLRVPPRLAYGARGVEGVVPPNAALIFLIDVISVERPAGP
jgi:hypothetical protein